MKNNVYEALVYEVQGPFVKVRQCRLCQFRITYRLGGGGRGGGMVRGNKARGQMIQHLRQTHPQDVAKHETPAEAEKGKP